MIAMENIKVSCQCCRNDRFYRTYQPIEQLNCPECNSSVVIYMLNYGLRTV